MGKSHWEKKKNVSGTKVKEIKLSEKSHRKKVTVISFIKSEYIVHKENHI